MKQTVTKPCGNHSRGPFANEQYGTDAGAAHIVNGAISAHPPLQEVVQRTVRRTDARPDRQVNECWVVYVVGAPALGANLRIISVINEGTRECLAFVSTTSISGDRLASELETLVRDRGCPVFLVSDNGMETTPPVRRWARERGVRWRYGRLVMARRARCFGSVNGEL